MRDAFAPPRRPDDVMPPHLGRISDYLIYGARTYPDRAAFIEDGLVRTYGAAAAEVDLIARALIASGVGPGDRVATLAAPGMVAYQLFLATAMIGACWCGLNPRHSPHELAHPLTDAAPVLVFSEAGMPPRRYHDEIRSILALKVPAARLVVLPEEDSNAGSWREFIDSGKAVSDADLEQRVAGVATDDPCLIIYTSGTSGIPKGAVLTHYGLVFCSLTDARYNLEADGQVMLCNFPINHIASIGDVCSTTLVIGGTIVFMRVFDPPGILEAIARHRITHLGQIPAMFQMILADPVFQTADLSSLRVVMWGGNPASADLVRRLRATGVRLCNVYGMTETTGNVIFARGDLSDEQFSASIGVPPPEYEVCILREDETLAEEGETGELHVRGRFVMQAYWRNPEATRAAFTSAGWFRTGDLARRRSDGLIELVGRRSDMFKSGGYNIYPAEIEQAIEAHPDVSLAVVVGVPDPLYSETGTAFVVLSRPGTDGDALQVHCRSRLANYKIPKRFFILESLPMLANGKVDRRALRERAAQS